MMLTMYYVHAFSVKGQACTNIPAENVRNAYDVFTQENPNMAIDEIKPLFSYDDNPVVN